MCDSLGFVDHEAGLSLLLVCGLATSQAWCAQDSAIDMPMASVPGPAAEQRTYGIGAGVSGKQSRRLRFGSDSARQRT